MTQPPPPSPPRTIVQKILDAHQIHEEGGRRLIYVDRLVVADTAVPAFRSVDARGYAMRRPGQALIVPDHYTPSTGPSLDDVPDEERRAQIRNSEALGASLDIQVFGLGDPRRGIQHVVSTEQAYAQPGVTLVAADSHTSTQGAVGALAFSIGPDLPHVIATQCIWLKSPKMMRITLDGALAPGVSPKDVALALVARVGIGGGAGHAIEYAGSFVDALSLEGRMTICNLTAEMGALMGIIAPDARTFDYLRGRPYAPKGAMWEQATAYWRTLASDADAVFDREIRLDVGQVEPMVTWGNSVENAVGIGGVVPDPEDEPDLERRAQMIRSLDYMGLVPGIPLEALPIDQVFIGSCANSRIEDLRAAAERLRGRHVAVPTLVVPGSGLVKAQAEAEGLDRIFRSAGADWGEAGCSMCVSMNGDSVAPGARCASTSNRNHMGRQGRGSRTHLVSPAMAAAAAVAGCLTDIRMTGDA